jgi:hypothetical protein
VKRSPLVRRSPLVARTPLRPGRFKRTKSVETPERRDCRKVVRERDGGLCRLRIPGVCVGRGWVVHEPLTRARGGNEEDPLEAVLSCAPCHSWAHDHDAAARALGCEVMLASWDRDGLEELRAINAGLAARRR